MKKSLLLAVLSLPLLVFSQNFKLGKGADTLFTPAKDTVFNVPFVLETPYITGDKEVTISVGNGGTATSNVHFNLRDAYNKNVSKVQISNVENRAGYFNLYIPKGLDKVRIIYFTAVVKDGGKRTTYTVHLYIAPQEEDKKPKKEPERTEPKAKDTLIKEIYRDININVTGFDREKVCPPAQLKKERDAKAKGREDHYDCKKLINIQKVLITEKADREYLIEVYSTDDERYTAIVKVNDSYKFLDADQLYLDGDENKEYINAHEFIRITKKGKDERTEELTPAKPVSRKGNP